ENVTAADCLLSAARTGCYASERTDVFRLRSLLPLGRVELDLLVLIQRPVAGARDRGEVHEHVRRPVIGGDETKALIGVEPLHCSCCHQSTSSTRHAMTRLRRADRELTGPGSRYGVHPQFPVFRGTGRRVSPTPPPASMPCSVTRPVAAAAPPAILDDAKASRSRSPALRVWTVSLSERRVGPELADLGSKSDPYEPWLYSQACAVNSWCM